MKRAGTASGNAHHHEGRIMLNRALTLALLSIVVAAPASAKGQAVRRGQSAGTITIVVAEKRYGGWDASEPFDVEWGGQCSGSLYVSVPARSGHAQGGGDHWAGLSSTCLLTNPVEIG